MSFLEHVPVAPTDAVFGLSAAYEADPFPNKLNLGVGAYRTEEGKPYVLPVVRKVELELNENKEYLPIEGHRPFVTAAASTLLGAELYAKHGPRIASVQSISGTGAVRLGAELVRAFIPDTAVYISNPTWGNHRQIFTVAGLKVFEYRYFDKNTNGLDLDGMLADLQAAPNRSTILLHLCAHNPTGVDPTPAQWQQIVGVLKDKNHFAFFDSAYQGFATGDLERDAAPFRNFVDQGFEGLCCQSFAKNMGLYGERVGALHVLTPNPQSAEAVFSQLKILIRANFSTPPKHGALIAGRILNSPELRAEWYEELKIMSGRIMEMRHLLHEALVARGTPGNWNHILSQIGMFSFTGLTPVQCAELINKHHVYLLSNGRISMAGLSRRVIPYLADAIHDVVTRLRPNL